MSGLTAILADATITRNTNSVSGHECRYMQDLLAVLKTQALKHLWSTSDDNQQTRFTTTKTATSQSCR
jgi:hypothetical protein